MRNLPLKVQADVSVDGEKSSLGIVQKVVIFAQQIDAVLVSRRCSRSLKNVFEWVGVGRNTA